METKYLTHRDAVINWAKDSATVGQHVRVFPDYDVLQGTDICLRGLVIAVEDGNYIPTVKVRINTRPLMGYGIDLSKDGNYIREIDITSDLYNNLTSSFVRAIKTYQAS